jgi:putative glycosyltransferase (TIGR04372 family)
MTSPGGTRPPAGSLAAITRTAAFQNRVQDIAFRIRFVQQKGIAWTLGRLASRVLGLVASVALLPVTVALHLLGFRHVDFVTDRIGHLALEPDCLLREQALGRIPRRRWIFLAPAGQVANEHLLEYWRKHFIVVRSALSCFLVRSMGEGSLMRFDVSRYLRAFGRTQDAYGIYAAWGERKPPLTLLPQDEDWGREVLARLGVPPDTWFACVHVRESGFSPFDEELHSHRNGSIENAIPAIEEITRRGGWAIRIGDPTMRPLPPMERMIDYAHHPIKSPRMDVFLCARARFILGNTSGIALLGTIFGVPCAVANVIPASVLWFNRNDICAPKLLWSKDANRYLRLDEIFCSSLSSYHHAVLYAMAGVVPVENTSEDILDMTREILDRLKGAFVVDDEDEHILAHVANLLRHGYIENEAAARISLSFLRRNREILLPELARRSPIPG